MRDIKNIKGLLLRSATIVLAPLLAWTAQAAAPGITGPAFDLSASAAGISQPDGATVYAWGYGCNTAPTGFLPATVAGAKCPVGSMQLPGPTLIVNQGDIVTVTLHNSLPAAAGNTSILFPGFNVCVGNLTGATATASGTCTVSATNPGVAGILTQEASNATAVTYSFYAGTPGTHSYYSGTQGDLQVEMGLYGALIVLPINGNAVPTAYISPSAGSHLPDTCHAAGTGTLPNGAPDYRLAAAAYNNPAACYDREYLFQFSEMDPRIHRQAEEQAQSPAGLACTQPTGCMAVETEPYHPTYFLINGRSMPDDMDPNYAVQYPHQPYNGNPHMHPGELTLLRVIGTGRAQHPFHEHGNHVRLLARDGNLILSQTPGSTNLAGPLLFTTTTTPGMAFDGIFQWTAKGLNWDVYGHVKGGDAGNTTTCAPDANGFYTTGSNAPVTASNYFEWCGDHERPLESKPFGNVGSGGPVTLPDANIVANGAWYAGSPYLGGDANTRAVGSTPIPPSGTVANSPTDEAGFAFMWHSHNEREITTNNIFPGGMMMMMLVDPWVFPINESN
jgi:FtsP/CotA-like multicopper oxidase with cupredoxin domain